MDLEGHQQEQHERLRARLGRLTVARRDELARKAGLSPRTLQRWLTGTTRTPQLLSLLKLSKEIR